MLPPATLLPPATKLRQGNVFTPVSLSVHGAGGGLCLCTTGHMTRESLLGRPPGQTPPHTVISRRYASCLNAFLFYCSESYMFNALESIAKSENPCTPVLGCRISNVLEPQKVSNMVSVGNDLPSPAEILHGRSLITGEPVTVDHAKVKAVLVGRQIKDSQQYNKSHRVKSQRTLVLGERCWGTGTNNEWLDCYITGIDKENRCYWVVFEDTGRRLRRTRSHLRPRGPDFPSYFREISTAECSFGRKPGSFSKRRGKSSK